MEERSGKLVAFPQGSSRDILTEVLREGARQMLATAIEAEVQRDRRGLGERESFHSSILPPYLRKTKSLEDLLPWLYLKGVSTGEFSEALAALLGPEAPGLSAATITRLKAVWQEELASWQSRTLAGKRYVYVWADGIYFNIRLEEPGNARQCILVLMGATAEGKKELLAVADGYRESEQSWLELLLDLRSRGLAIDPELATGDGALGFWKALAKVFPKTRHQRCWVHKTANVLNKLPKSVQAKAKSMLQEIWMAPTRAAAEKAFGQFVETFRAKYAAAVSCLAATAWSFLPSMHSRPSTGSTCGRPTRSSRPSPRFACARTRRRAAAAASPA